MGMFRGPLRRNPCSSRSRAAATRRGWSLAATWCAPLLHTGQIRCLELALGLAVVGHLEHWQQADVIDTGLEGAREPGLLFPSASLRLGLLLRAERASRSVPPPDTNPGNPVSERGSRELSFTHAKLTTIHHIDSICVIYFSSKLG